MFNSGFQVIPLAYICGVGNHCADGKMELDSGRIIGTTHEGKACGLRHPLRGQACVMVSTARQDAGTIAEIDDWKGVISSIS
ncbi:hypothetical protein LIER_38803 [Lithospermum erythrorhizon]|uniref:Uncharacterized protein n=1 Tax=Lithospermum erythrorhizon TaxID=34254 RepID=A0AAV3Q512_LITER